MTPLPDDPAALIQLAQAALAPAGCLELTADVRQRAAVSAVHSDRVWTFTGRIEGGVWTVMEWTPVVDPEGGGEHWLWRRALDRAVYPAVLRHHARRY